MVQKHDLAEATVRGVFWIYTSQISGKLLIFTSTIILAWLLTKTDFGVVGYALVVFNFLDILSDLGVGVALIYHREDPEAANTAFWLGVAISLVLAGVMWLIAPLVSELLARGNSEDFDQGLVISLTRALALIFPLESLRNVHSALLQKQLAFNRKFIPEFIKAASKGLVTILFALLGFGAWSLVLGQICSVVASVVAYWWVLPWRPALQFNLELAQPLLSYGSSMVGVSLIGTVGRNVDYLLIGPFLGAAALGVYTVAFRLPEFLILHSCTLIARAIFPAYARMRDDSEALSRAFLTTMGYIASFTVPVGLGMALVAGPLIRVLFPGEWAEAIPVTRAIALYALLLSLTYNVGDVYKAQGRPSVLAKLSLIQTLVLVPALLWAVAVVGDITAVAWTQTAVSGGYVLLNFVVASKMLGVPLKRIVEALQPVMVASLLMTATVFTTLALLASIASPLWQLTVSTVVGALTYGTALWWLQQEFVLKAGHTLRTALMRR